MLEQIVRNIFYVCIYLIVYAFVIGGILGLQKAKGPVLSIVFILLIIFYMYKDVILPYIINNILNINYLMQIFTYKLNQLKSLFFG